jgi:hypothetical protein
MAGVVMANGGQTVRIVEKPASSWLATKQHNIIAGVASLQHCAEHSPDLSASLTIKNIAKLGLALVRINVSSN